MVDELNKEYEEYVFDFSFIEDKNVVEIQLKKRYKDGIKSYSIYLEDYILQELIQFFERKGVCIRFNNTASSFWAIDFVTQR